MFYVANSLMTLQALFGVIPKIFGKGEMAKVGDFTLRIHTLTFVIVMCNISLRLGISSCLFPPRDYSLDKALWKRTLA